MDFQDGQTQIINGVTYRRQGGLWHAQTPMAPARQPSPQTTAQATQDALQVDKLRSDINNIPQTRRAQEVNIQQGQTSIANTAFSQKDKLRSDFQALPQVKTYTEFLPAVFKAIQAPDNAQGDLAVLISFSKAMDPTTGVKEGEAETARNTASLQQQAQVWLQRVQQGQRLPPEVRHNFVETMREAGKQLSRSYGQQRSFYTELAKRNGADPFEIVGPDAYAPFAGTEKSYIEGHGGLPKVDGVPAAPNSPPVAGGGTEQGFDLKADPRHSTLTPEQAAAYDAFWKANPNPTPQQLQSFAHGIGIGEIGNAQEIIDAKRKGGAISHDVEVTPDISDVRGKDGDAFNAGVRGVVDSLSLGAVDKGVALADTIFKGGTFDQNLGRQYAISDFDQEQHPIARLTGQAGGAAMLPMGEMKSIGQVAMKSAAMGAGYGAGSSRSISDVPTNALLGAGGGAVVGGALASVGKGINALAVGAGRKIAGQTSPEQRAILDAGAQEGVPVNMTDIYPQTRNTAATLESIPLSSGPIRQGIAQGRDAMERRVGDLARGGTPRRDMGQAVQDAGRGFVKKANKQASRLYDHARSMAGDTPIAPNTVKSVTDGLLQVEEATPGGTKAGQVIRKYADAFQNGQNITIDGARRMRSELLSTLRTDGGLSKGEATRITGQIMGAVNQDIESALTSSGRKGAVEAYRHADRFYAQTREEIEQNIERFVGTDRAPKSVEQTVQAMNNAASPKSGNAKALTGLLARLSPDERRDYAATLVQHLGRKSAEESFSPGTFLTNIRSMSPQARQVIFGAEGERSIQNLIRLATAKQETVGRLNNSRSGQVTNYRNVISQLLVGLPGGGALLGAGAAFNGATGAVGGAAIGGTILGGARALAKAFMNEEFTRAIAQAPATTSPKAINAHFGRLRQIAAKDPSVRAVVESLEQKLMSHANDNTLRAAAASPDGSEEDKKQK